MTSADDRITASAGIAAHYRHPATGKIRSPARGSMRCMPVKLPNAGSTPTAFCGKLDQ